MRGKITKRTVDALHAPSAGEVTLWDEDVAGFGIRARAGGTKTYILRYRPGGGRRAALRTYTIGRHGSPWTPDQARQETVRILTLVRQGKDPQHLRMKARAAESVEAVARHFLADFADTKKKPGTAAEYRRMIERLVIPVLGKRKATEIDTHDIARLHASLRRTPVQANRTLAVLSKMFAWAEIAGYRPQHSNPARNIEKFREKGPRERMLTPIEIAVLGDALAAIDGSPYASAAIRLLMFTGARRSEILGLQWHWIDFSRGEARLPDSKTGTKTVHLPAPALEILAQLPRIRSNPYVIAGSKKGGHLINIAKSWGKVRATATVKLWGASEDNAVAGLIANLVSDLGREPTVEECHAAAKERDLNLPEGLETLRLHDLRHAFASIAASSGMGLPIIGKILGHSQASTTQRYAHLAADPVKTAAAAVADKIAGAMKGEAAGGTVVSMTKRKGQS
jgi:integrase